MNDLIKASFEVVCKRKTNFNKIDLLKRFLSIKKKIDISKECLTKRFEI